MRFLSTSSTALIVLTSYLVAAATVNSKRSESATNIDFHAFGKSTDRSQCIHEDTHSSTGGTSSRWGKAASHNYDQFRGRPRFHRRSEPDGPASGASSSPGLSKSRWPPERHPSSSDSSNDRRSGRNSPDSPRSTSSSEPIERDLTLYEYYKHSRSQLAIAQPASHHGVGSANLETWAGGQARFMSMMAAIENRSPQIRAQEWNMLRGIKPEGYDRLPKLRDSMSPEEKATRKLRMIPLLKKWEVPKHQRPELMLRLEAEARALMLQIHKQHKPPDPTLDAVMREEEKRIEEEAAKRDKEKRVKEEAAKRDEGKRTDSTKKREEEQAQRKKLKNQKKYEKKKIKKQELSQHEASASTSSVKQQEAPSTPRHPRQPGDSQFAEPPSSKQSHGNPKGPEAHKKPVTPSQAGSRSPMFPGAPPSPPQRRPDGHAATHPGGAAHPSAEPGSPSSSDSSEVFADH